MRDLIPGHTATAIPILEFSVSGEARVPRPRDTVFLCGRFRLYAALLRLRDVNPENVAAEGRTGKIQGCARRPANETVSPTGFNAVTR